MQGFCQASHQIKRSLEVHLAACDWVWTILGISYTPWSLLSWHARDWPTLEGSWSHCPRIKGTSWTHCSWIDGPSWNSCAGIHWSARVRILWSIGSVTVWAWCHRVRAPHARQVRTWTRCGLVSWDCLDSYSVYDQLQQNQHLPGK